MRNLNYNYNSNRTLRNQTYTRTRSNSRIDSFKNHPITLVLMAVILITIGIFSIVTGVQAKERYDTLVDGGHYTYGEINDVDSRTSSTRTGKHSRSRKTYYYVSGTYTVGQQKYQFSFKSEIKLAEGGSVKLYYDQNNPSNYVKEGYDGSNIISSVMFIIIGAVFGGAGIKKHYDKKASQAVG